MNKVPTNSNRPSKRKRFGVLPPARSNFDEVLHLVEAAHDRAVALKQRRRETGETTPRPMGGATIFKIDLARLEELVHQQPDATGPELRVRLGVQCSDAAIYMALARLGLTFKKRRSARRSRPGSTSSDRSSSMRPGPRPT